MRITDSVLMILAYAWFFALLMMYVINFFKKREYRNAMLIVSSVVLLPWLLSIGCLFELFGEHYVWREFQYILVEGRDKNNIELYYMFWLSVSCCLVLIYFVVSKYYQLSKENVDDSISENKTLINNEVQYKQCIKCHTKTESWAKVCPNCEEEEFNILHDINR